MISVIDYKMGNLQSICGGLISVGAEIDITANPERIRNAEGIVLPGVGAFETGMRHLREYGLIDVLRERIDAGVPFLGICIGMQLLFSQSEEKGIHEGLGVIPGRVVHFENNLKIPHMGWNTIDISRQIPLLEGISDSPYFYFVHSYFCIPENEDDCIAFTEYGQRYCSVVARNNVWGTQFHPEKSQKDGLRVLENFVKLTRTYTHE